MSKYRKKPVVIEAVVWDGSAEAIKFASQADRDLKVDFGDNKPSLFIETLEGVHEAKFGDYIIKGIQGELYPCKPDIFKATYEEVDNENIKSD